MQLTLFGILLLPVVFISFAHPERLLQMILLTSVFGAASALNVGALGVVPDLIPAAAFVGFVLLQMLLGVRYPGITPALRTLTPLLLTSAYGLAGAAVLPRLFAGQILVHPQKSLLGGPVPLAFDQGNITQSIYLCVNMVFVSLASIFLTRSRVDFNRLLKAYLISGFVAFGFALWQFADRVAHLGFPASLLYSNPGYAILPTQDIAGVPRISGSYTEPSALGAAMVGYVFACVWLLIRGHQHRLAKFLLPCALLGCAVSTSTTGFGALAIGGAWLVARALLSASRQVLSKIMIGLVVVSLTGGVGIVALTSLAPNIVGAANKVIAGTLDKQNSASYADRTTSDADSLATLAPSYGLGVGWGSNRSSSLGPGLLAGLGVYGCLLLVWFVITLLRQVGRVRPIAVATGRAMTMDAMLAAMFADLVSGALSGPTIGDVGFFVKLAIVLGGAARLEVECARRSVHQRHLARLDYEKRQARPVYSPPLS